MTKINYGIRCIFNFAVICLTTFLVSGCGIKTSSSLMINIEDFGANGKDKKDDTFQIQAAIDALLKGNGTELYIPKGNYYISQKTSYNFGLHIQDAENLKITGNGAVIHTKAGAPIGRPLVIRNSNRVTVENLTFRSAETNPKKPLNGLVIMNSNNVTVNNCKFYKQTNYGVAVTEDTVTKEKRSCNNITITNCLFDEVGKIGLEIFPKAKSDVIRIKGNRFYKCGYNIPKYGVATKCNQAYRKSYIEDNVFELCGKGTSSFAVALSLYDESVFRNNTMKNCSKFALAIFIHDHKLFQGATHRSLLIENNKFINDESFLSNGKGLIGININSTRPLEDGEIIIKDNTFENWHWGIYFRPKFSIDKVVIAGNQFNNCTQLAINADLKKAGDIKHLEIVANDIRVSANTSARAVTKAKSAIVVKDLKDVTIKDNTFSGYTDKCIKTDAVSKTAKIQSNTFKEKNN